MTTRAHLVLTAMLLSAAATLHAQEPPCGVSTVKETAPLVYPPIAKAAHVGGLVIIRAEFSKDGTVSKAEIWRGPTMLQAVSLRFVEGLHANPYGGSRTCLLTVTFAMRDQIPPDFRGDTLGAHVEEYSDSPLHYFITASTGPLYSIVDPAGKIIRKRFLGIF